MKVLGDDEVVTLGGAEAEGWLVFMGGFGGTASSWTATKL